MLRIVRYPTWISLLLCAGCGAHLAPTVSPAVMAPSHAESSAVAASPDAVQASALEIAPAPAESTVPAVASGAPSATVAFASASASLVSAPVDAAPPAEEDPGEEAGEESGDAEAEVTGSEAPPPSGPLYTMELTDEALTEAWKKEPKTLGPISVGFVQSGRIINSVQFPSGAEWLVVSPELAWATQETIDSLTGAIREVRAEFPRAPQIRVNQISAREGGHLRPHKSHQNGRDVDLGFYYPTVDPVRERAREKVIDLELNWALIKALVIHSDVQMIIVDKRIQKTLREYALSQGEDQAWVDSLFVGPNPLFLHARGHRDHFHVRFFNPRAQELGRRIAPLLALQPEQNIMMHRVRSGDSLGKIAQRYGSSIAGIKKSNRMNGILLRIGQVLSVPLRGPCTQCPVPPPVVIPPRRLPPPVEQDAPAVAGEPVADHHPASPSPTRLR